PSLPASLHPSTVGVDPMPALPVEPDPDGRVGCDDLLRRRDHPELPIAGELEIDQELAPARLHDIHPRIDITLPCRHELHVVWAKAERGTVPTTHDRAGKEVHRRAPHESPDELRRR